MEQIITTTGETTLDCECETPVSETPVYETPECEYETPVCETPVCEIPDYKCESHTICTTPLIIGVIIGIIGVLVGACGLIITCVTVKWR